LYNELEKEEGEKKQEISNSKEEENLLKRKK
jgi:hypothetical protein